MWANPHRKTYAIKPLGGKQKVQRSFAVWRMSRLEKIVANAQQNFQLMM